MGRDPAPHVDYSASEAFQAIFRRSPMLPLFNKVFEGANMKLSK